MFPQIARRSVPRGLRLVVLAALLGAAVGACQPATFDPSTPCTADGRAAGAYPDLEASVPTTYDARRPDRLDSGRNCTERSLGSLTTHGVKELRFAGAVWDRGSGSGVTFAILEADELELAWVAEFYEAGARAGRRVEEVTVTKDYPLGPVRGTRIDVLNGESFQSVIVGPDAMNRARVLIVANAIREIQTREAHERVVAIAEISIFEGVCCN